MTFNPENITNLICQRFAFQINIYVSDVNDCSPEFEKLNMTATIMEGSEKGFSVYRVTATDCDYDPQNRNLTYSINGIDKGKHNITYYNIYIWVMVRQEMR